MTDKLRNLERVIQQEQEQPFVLFGLFERTEGIGLWDLVVASRELEPGLDSTLYLSRKLARST